MLGSAMTAHRGKEDVMAEIKIYCSEEELKEFVRLADEEGFEFRTRGDWRQRINDWPWWWVLWLLLTCYVLVANYCHFKQSVGIPTTACSTCKDWRRAT
jgi:hypothetical protein